MHVYIEYLCAYMCIYDVHTIREKKKERDISRLLRYLFNL